MKSRFWRPCSTPCLLTSATVGNLLLLLLFPRYNGGFSTVIAKCQHSTARETFSVLWRFAEYTQTDGADKSGIDDLAMAKAGRSKVDSVMGRRND